MNQLKTDAYLNVEHIPSFSNTDVNDVSLFRNSTDTVSQRALESVDDELHRQFDEDTWSIRFPNSEEEMGLEDQNHHSEEEMDLEDPNHETDEFNITEELARWAVSNNISHKATTDLLKVLQHVIPDLPNDSRTLLGTIKIIKCTSVAGGDYFYFGVQYWLEKYVNLMGANICPNILHININIDGIPLFKSSTTSLWPILASISDNQKSDVFPVALFGGTSKPNSVNDYLSEFVAEMKILENTGFVFEGKIFNIFLNAVICDAPARAFVKCIKTHNSYNCCERCVQTGEWHNKIVLPGLDCINRTDESFIANHDPHHHVGISPLSQLSLGMVSSFPLDYMHLICLGVARRLLHLWLHGPRNTRLSHGQITIISDRLIALRLSIPCEFSRKTRSLLEFKRWKATEFRLFVIYTGPVVLKGILSPNLYLHFLNLSVTVRLLLTPNLNNNLIDYSSQLLKYFVNEFGNLYGKNQLVYNVHSLIHLPDDVRRFGTLDNVSSFKFETFLYQLKKLVRKPNEPVAQIVKRIKEGHLFLKKNETSSLIYHCLHLEGPLPRNYSYCMQYKKISTPNYTLSIQPPDNCCIIDGKVGLVKNILCKPQEENNACGYIVFQSFIDQRQFFDDPLDSALLNICYVKNLGEFNIFPVVNVKTKCLILPFNYGFVAFPQLH